MKKKFLTAVIATCIAIFSIQSASAYMVKYKEDYYKLFHVHYQQYPDDVIENIYWLEHAVKADFCNPLYANQQRARLGKIPLSLYDAYKSQAD